MTEINIPRIMLSAACSGSGKTTVTAAVLSALCRRGLKVSSFKCGPDYIDPMFHTFVTGRSTCHLDPFFSSPSQLCGIAANAGAGTDVSVIEGAMGFYDGTGKTSDCSAYTVARVVSSPVVLVTDPSGSGVSCAAMIKGFTSFRPENNIKGVLLNRIKPVMYGYYRDIIENETGLKVCGYLPVVEDAHIESRHLGLVTSGEIDDLAKIIRKLGICAEETVDLDALLTLAQTAPPLQFKEYDSQRSSCRYRLGIAKDRAFCFYYEENIGLLEKNGADIVEFSPLSDSSLPDDLDGIYLGGGYPELYLKELSSNTSFLSSLQKSCSSGMPVFAECGGFMYLLEGIKNKDGEVFSMAGVLKGTAVMGNRLCRFGYADFYSHEETLISHKGTVLKGHEFHYSDSDGNGDAFSAVKPDGRSWEAVVSEGNITAGYPHFYFPSDPVSAEIFSRKCSEFRKKRCL